MACQYERMGQAPTKVVIRTGQPHAFLLGDYQGYKVEKDWNVVEEVFELYAERLVA